MKKLKFHDFEVYPEWWCIVVSDEEDSYLSSSYKNKFTEEEEQKIKSKMRVYTSDGGRADIERLREDTKTGVWAGYNIKRYDLIILNAVLMGFTTEQLYILNEIIFNPEAANKSMMHRRVSAYAKRKFQGLQAFQDLMDDSDKGVKDKEAAYGMDIRETEVPFDTRNLTQEQKDSIIYYCKHDVFANHVQYITIAKPYIDNKLALCNTYDLTHKVGYESTNAVLSGRVLKAKRVSGTTIKDPTIVVYQTELDNYFRKWIPAELYNHLLTSQSAKNMVIFENRVYTADGGLHSVLEMPRVGRTLSKLYVEATEEYGLWNVDASSCYPATMIHCNAMPRGVADHKLFAALYNKRLELKFKPKSEWTTKEKEFVPAAKLVLNTTYGAMGNKYLPLYDDYMRSKVCRVGQMILIALANNIYLSTGCKIIQTNTDGVLVYGPRKKLPQIQAIVKEFEDLSKFVFEIEEDKKIWQLNVNNYIAVDINDKVKQKGQAFITSIFQPGYNRVRPLGTHVIAKAQIDFYLNGTNPVEYLLKHTEVADFCITCTKGPTYFGMVQKTRDGDIPMGRVARVIGTKTEKYGVIKKQKYVDGVLREDTVANCPPHTWIVNDALRNYRIEGPYNDRRLIHKDGSSAQIDFSHYANKLNEALNHTWYKLKDGQMKLTKEFNL